MVLGLLASCLGVSVALNWRLIVVVRAYRADHEAAVRSVAELRRMLIEGEP